VSEAIDPLVVTDAGKSFGAVRALDGASLTLRAGELLGLLGPNGAGKTTMVRAVSGRIGLERGAITIYGRPVSQRGTRPEVGVVPQELAVYSLLTARENLEIFARLYGVPAGTVGRRVAWALEWSDLAGRAAEPVGRFSGGMKRRLNIACGLLHEPRIVLLDEPTVGVDPQSRERIYEMLASLRREGVSVLLTTHHLEEAEERCDRIVILDQGRVVATGTMRQLLASVGSRRVVRAVLASPLAEHVVLPDPVSLQDDRLHVSAPVDDVGRDVSSFIRTLESAGAGVADLAVTAASLQDVFIALTGRELRE